MTRNRLRPRCSVLLVFTLLAAASIACSLSRTQPQMERLNVQSPLGTASATIPPSTPLATLTPSRTLLPPPTFEPPTQTPFPSLTPSVTPTEALNLEVSIPGLHGGETPTPTTTPGCEPNKDWKLTYTVQANDALVRIAQRFNTNANALAQGNCLNDPNMIRVGQELRVPGDSYPVQPEVVCVPFELMTPINGTLAVEGEGSITFNWRGPRAPRNLIRIHRPDGSIYERVVELRQNESIDLYENLWQAGTYTWFVYPLDSNFVQVCPEGGPWMFTKTQSPTATPTSTETDEPENQQPKPTIIIVTATPSKEVPTEETTAES